MAEQAAQHLALYLVAMQDLGANASREQWVSAAVSYIWYDLQTEAHCISIEF